jgi:hypothetical protein
VLEGCVIDFALAKVVAANKAFFPEHIQGPVDRGEIDGRGLFSQRSVNLFRGHVTLRMGHDLDDHLTLGRDPVSEAVKLIDYRVTV